MHEQHIAPVVAVSGFIGAFLDHIQRGVQRGTMISRPQVNPAFIRSDKLHLCDLPLNIDDVKVKFQMSFGVIPQECLTGYANECFINPT